MDISETKSGDVDGRRLRGEKSRTRVLQFATSIAAIEGLEGLTFGKVAAASKIAKSTLQVLFEDRQGLQLQTLNAAADSFSAGIEQGLQRYSAAPNRLHALCDAWFDLVSDSSLPGGCLVTAAATEYRAREGAVRASVHDHRARWRSHLRAAAHATIKAGELPAETDVEQLVFDILAFQGAANIARGEGSEEDFAMARRGVERLLAKSGQAREIR